MAEPVPLTSPPAHAQSSLSSLSPPSVGSWWLLVNTVQYSPRQFISHAAHTPQWYLTVGGATEEAWLCAWVRLACINAPVFVRIEDISFNPDSYRQKGKATDRRCIDAGSCFVFLATAVLLFISPRMQNASLETAKQHFLSDSRGTCSLKPIFCLTWY